MNKEQSQYQPGQIYTKKRNIDSVISIRSVQSNKSSSSTKTKSNVSSTVNDLSSITSFVFNITNALLITSINDSITSSVISSVSPIDSHEGLSLASSSQLHHQAVYMHSCVNFIDNRVQGTLSLSEVGKGLQEKVIGLMSESNDALKSEQMIDGSNSNTIKHCSELKILRMDKQALCPRNNSNDTKVTLLARKKEKDRLISLVKGSRFLSPPVGHNNKANSIYLNANEEKSMEKNCKEEPNAQINNITPVSIKIKVFNSNVNEKTSRNHSKKNALIKPTATKRIMKLPNKGKDYVKSSSPRPSISSEMHNEMNATCLIKPNTNNQSLGMNAKPIYRAESPIFQKHQIIRKQLQPVPVQSHTSTLPYVQSEMKSERDTVKQSEQSSIPKPIKAKVNSILVKPPFYPKKIEKRDQPQPIGLNPRRTSKPEDKLNLSCDDISKEKSRKTPKTKQAPVKSELNKSFETFEPDYAVFDFDNDIFSVINDSSIILPEKASLKHSHFDSKREQVKLSLDLISKSNEIAPKGEDWERASANFHKEQPHDCFDRFSFHNKKVE